VERLIRRPPDEDAVRAVLNTIIDPCSRAAGAPAGLVDMGLIRHLKVMPATDRDGVDVQVVIGVTEYACLIGPSFAAEARKKLASMAGIRNLVIDLDGEFDWDPQDMSQAYQAQLRERRRAGNAYFLALRDTRRNKTSDDQ
jgi:metal-sulfur cluster biosynthetic enzyme